MKFRLMIEVDNAAFDGERAAEVARILRECADRVEEDMLPTVEDPAHLRDINGNRVGVAWLSPE